MMFIHKDWQLIYPLVIFVCELYISQTIITRSYAFFKSKIKTRCKIFLFLFLIFRLSLSSSHFQRIKLIKSLFTKYKSKLIRVPMVTIQIQLTVSIVLWIIIAVTLMGTLFKMFCVIIYRHNQLKSLSWILIKFSNKFNKLSKFHLILPMKMKATTRIYIDCYYHIKEIKVVI